VASCCCGDSTATDADGEGVPAFTPFVRLPHPAIIIIVTAAIAIVADLIVKEDFIDVSRNFH
jgi:uncharacterized membrane protein (DUF106 family)